MPVQRLALEEPQCPCPMAHRGQRKKPTQPRRGRSVTPTLASASPGQIVATLVSAVKKPAVHKREMETAERRQALYGRNEFSTGAVAVFQPAVTACCLERTPFRCGQAAWAVRRTEGRDWTRDRRLAGRPGIADSNPRAYKSRVRFGAIELLTRQHSRNEFLQRARNAMIFGFMSLASAGPDRSL